MRGGAQGRRARESTRPDDSPLRHGWTWRRRVMVQVTGAVIALVLRVLYLTLAAVQQALATTASRAGAWADGTPA